MLGTYLMMCATLLFIDVIIGITPKFMRKNIHFGIMLPYEASEQEQVKNWSKQFFLASIIATFIAIALLTIVALTANGTTEENIELIAIVGSVAMIPLALLQFILYFVFHNRAKKFKSENYATHEYKERERITVDTAFREGNKSSFVWALLISGVIIVVTAAVPMIHYHNIPHYIPNQWSQGQPTAYIEKSRGFFMMMPGMQLIMVVSIALANHVIQNAKQIINPRKAIASSKNNQTYRKATTIFLTFTQIATVLFMMFIQLGLTFSINPEPSLNWLVGVYIGAIFIGLLYFMIKYGQGGSRLKETGDDANNFNMYDDDAYWKWGMIYYNPNDPALFVEKKFGIGATVNFAHKTSWWIILGITILGVVIPLLSVFMSFW